MRDQKIISKVPNIINNFHSVITSLICLFPKNVLLYNNNFDNDNNDDDLNKTDDEKSMILFPFFPQMSGLALH